MISPHASIRARRYVLISGTCQAYTQDPSKKRWALAASVMGLSTAKKAPSLEMYKQMKPSALCTRAHRWWHTHADLSSHTDRTHMWVAPCV